jgi:hypothetical protein
MPWDEGKTIGVKTCEQVLVIDRNIYKKRRPHKTNPKNHGLKLRTRAQIECSVIDPHPLMLVDSHPCIQGIEQYQISLTKVVGMTWMQKCVGFSMHVAHHSMFFTHPIGMKWYKPSMVHLKDIGALGMTKPEPWCSGTTYK